MKVTKIQVAIASVLVVVGVNLALYIALLKPEAAAPLTVALVTVGLARVGVAAYRARALIRRVPEAVAILPQGEAA